MNPSDAIEAIEKPLSSLPYSLSRHILEHLRKLTSHEPVPGIMGKSGAGKSSRKRAARTVLTGMCYSVGSATRQGSSSPTRFIGQSAMTSRT